MNHTPEPWGLLEVGGGIKFLVPHHENESILTVAVETTDKGNTFFGAVYKPEDARRIVACVNACDGIGNDYLEAFRLAPIIDEYQAMDKKIESLTADRDRLQETVNELKKAKKMGLALHSEICAKLNMAEADRDRWKALVVELMDCVTEFVNFRVGPQFVVGTPLDEAVDKVNKALHQEAGE